MSLNSIRATSVFCHSTSIASTTAVVSSTNKLSESHAPKVQSVFNEDLLCGGIE